MREYVIFTDSSADLSPERYEEYDVACLPLRFTIEGETYENLPDWSNFSADAFYGKLRAGEMSVTSQLNVHDFVQPFRKVLDEGKDIVYIGFSTGLSGTTNSARIAVKELREEYPQAHIAVVDTLAASLGQGLLVHLAVQKKREGLSADELVQWLNANRLNIAHWFTVDDLNHLKRGGRVSAATAMVGTMLNIKPVLHVDNEGHLVSVEKVRGRRQSLDTLVNRVGKTAIQPNEQTVFISHGDCLADAQYVEEQVKEKFGVKDVYINHVGPVIGSHAGPGVVALFFLATER